MISCREFLAEIGDYLDGLLTEEARQELEAHVSQCQTCQVVYDSTRKTLKLVTDSDSFDLPEGAMELFVSKVMTRVRTDEDPEPEPEPGSQRRPSE